MWYLLDSDKDATLLCGLKQQITPTQYAEMVANDTICDAIARYDVKEGDCFFLPAGRIHAIGTGCFLAEIQQTSDVTYRTPSRLPSASTIMLRAIIAPNILRRRTKV